MKTPVAVCNTLVFYVHFRYNFISGTVMHDYFICQSNQTNVSASCQSFLLIFVNLFCWLLFWELLLLLLLSFFVVVLVFLFVYFLRFNISIFKGFFCQARINHGRASWNTVPCSDIHELNSDKNPGKFLLLLFISHTKVLYEVVLHWNLVYL